MGGVISYLLMRASALSEASCFYFFHGLRSEGYDHGGTLFLGSRFRVWWRSAGALGPLELWVLCSNENFVSICNIVQLSSYLIGALDLFGSHSAVGKRSNNANASTYHYCSIGFSPLSVSQALHALLRQFGKPENPSGVLNGIGADWLTQIAPSQSGRSNDIRLPLGSGDRVQPWPYSAGRPLVSFKVRKLSSSSPTSDRRFLDPVAKLLSHEPLTAVDVAGRAPYSSHVTALASRCEWIVGTT
ncbi:hypothetical protein VTI28DRAFT_5085 [Corynascus sepedonium]